MNKCQRVVSTSYENGTDTTVVCGKPATRFHEDVKSWFCDHHFTYSYNLDGSLKAKTEESYGGSDEYSESGADDPIDAKHEEFGD